MEGYSKGVPSCALRCSKWWHKLQSTGERGCLELPGFCTLCIHPCVNTNFVHLWASGCAPRYVRQLGNSSCGVQALQGSAKFGKYSCSLQVLLDRIQGGSAAAGLPLPTQHKPVTHCNRSQVYTWAWRKRISGKALGYCWASCGLIRRSAADSFEDLLL